MRDRARPVLLSLAVLSLLAGGVLWWVARREPSEAGARSVAQEFVQAFDEQDVAGMRRLSRTREGSPATDADVRTELGTWGPGRTAPGAWTLRHDLAEAPVLDVRTPRGRVVWVLLWDDDADAYRVVIPGSRARSVAPAPTATP